MQVGSYGLRDADGRIRTVNYVADALGFRASVSTNEPGVDPKQDPAATSLTGAGIPTIAAPAPILAAAPLAAAPLAAAPLAAAPIALGRGYGEPAALLASAGPAISYPSSYSLATQHVSAAPALLAAAPAAPALLAGAPQLSGLGGYGNY